MNLNISISLSNSEREGNNGKLAKQDWWRYNYYKCPYLLLEDDETIIERYTDFFTNCFDIDCNGKISPLPMVDDDHRFARLFAIFIFLGQP